MTWDCKKCLTEITRSGIIRVLIEKELKMSKVVCSATVNLTRVDLGTVAQIVIDRIEDDYGYDTMVTAGVDESELLNALIADKTFQAIVCDKVAEDGRQVCEDPYGYFDAFDFIDNIGALMDIYDMVDAMDDIIRDAKKEPEITCIKVPEGYKLVKI